MSASLPSETARPSVRLHELAASLGASARARLAGPASPVALRDVTHDSRAAGPGVLYACRPGLRADGHDFAPEAVAAGSPALLVERELPLPVPQLMVDSVADQLGHVAAAVHGRPSQRLVLCGITGTNGKTTSAYLLEAALRAAGYRTGLIGTVETRIGSERVAGIRTTPESTDLQRLLRRMLDAGVTAGAMEVSSHGLALGRINGTRFRVAAFTNLTQDHLDFHADLAEYFAAKARLFTAELTEQAVCNVDDSHGRELAGRITVPVVTVSAAGEAAADVRATDVDAGPDGSMFTAWLAGRRLRMRTRLPGHFNVSNALLTLAVADAAGIDAEAAATGIGELDGVPGRMERIDAGQSFTVLVDYAHTPDSVENVLRAARALSRGRLLVVLGCGGDRDRQKRPFMGHHAVRYADRAIFTNDNPRSEEPTVILDAMVEGARTVPDAHWTVEPDRRAAIALALDTVRPDDVVVIAGKGHEPYQELATGTVPFDDREVARDLLGLMGKARA
ncbi:MAG: UDP-N-acetylmuramoyl-L-alanyl-D-glutamate--2,6-diaminopimelate ligase [Egibacteraceae bacterium]